jgi:hypothetical protein
VDGEPAPKVRIPENDLTKMFSEADIAKFADEEPENRLLTAWPMIVQNLAQKSGTIKIQFKAPTVPGKYKFICSILSQEFLAADQSFEIEHVVVSADSVKRVPKEPKDEQENDEEGKKDK